MRNEVVARLAHGTMLGIVLAAPLAWCDAETPPAASVRVDVDWNTATASSAAKASLQVVPNPLYRRESKIHDAVFRALRELAAEDVRFVLWFPYPRLSVAELEPPRDGRTSWDFTHIDPLVVDFMEAAGRGGVMMNPSTIPQWMFITAKPVGYPADPNQIAWDYTQGTELRDASHKELVEYYARFLGWYTQGGFTDESGVRRDSPHRFRFDYWEVFNEPNGEHKMTPEQYTQRYDAIVTALRAVAPQLKFAGPGLAFPEHFLPFFEYFLDPARHRPGVPLDVLTYHFYAYSHVEETAGACPSAMFSQTDAFVTGVGKIETIRAKFRPELPTHINEIGAIDTDELRGQIHPGFKSKEIPAGWWNASAAVFAYQFGVLSRAGIEVVGQSALAQYPGQFPSVAMLDWETGRPNARYWTLKLLRERLEAGARLMPTTSSDPTLYAQAFASDARGRRLLLVNKCDRSAEVAIPPAQGARVAIVDQRTAFDPPREAELGADGKLRLDGYAVAVVTLPVEKSRAQ